MVTRSMKPERLLCTRLSLAALLQTMDLAEIKTALTNLQNSGHIMAFKLTRQNLAVYYYASTADLESILQELATFGSFIV